jgi:NAD-dependent deacetylase
VSEAKTEPRAEVERLAELVREAGERGTTVLTGAGISVPSGIPDFRSPGTGLWEKVDPMEVAHISVWERDPKRFWSFYRQRLDLPARFEPNPAHRALVELERRGYLRGLATQNIDGLHQKAGSSDVIELHGSVRNLVCLRCDERVPRERGLELFDSDGVPRCESCGAPLKPDVTLFGELLPPGAFERAAQLIEESRLLLCVGSSLEVYPVAQLPEIALQDGRRLALVTLGPTPFDPHADAKVEADVAEALSALAELLR